ncbi:hypothetical protein BUALT_Bualt18G0125300 [Buddleja alternifolia]|uniref:Potassium channel n=1 Tax=Buddleja alternifolia TaxID=168488 RepID=A0AAV6WAT0_9LAMI|nr:hypothetical protein BUALT_Bualt18G0125300 [Buddleja alternifolia]
MSFLCSKNFLKRFGVEEFHISTTHSGSFSSDLLPSLGARISRATKLRRYIVSPFDPRYRAWEMVLILMVIYSAWICPFEVAFLTYKRDALCIIDNIVDGFFAVDIVLTFFLAYLDSQSYILIDDPRKIAIRYLSTWFLFDVCSTVPFHSLRLLFTDGNSGVGFKLLSMLRLWRLRRVSSMFARLEKDIRFSYFWTRCIKLISVTLFAVHCAGCFNYMIADRYRDPRRTWIGAVHPNFKQMGAWDRYRDTVKAASEFAKRNQLTPRIQDQILSHICLNFKTEGLKQQETLSGLPKTIRSSIAHYLFYPIVQTVYLFHGVSHDFLFQLVPEMEAEYYPPREDVILQNEAPTDAYILVSGAVDFIARINGQDQIVGRASAGEIFGEIGVLCGKPQPFGVRTTEISQILRLDKTKFLNILRANPEDESCAMNNLFQKLKVWRSFDVEGQLDPSMILKNWLDGERKRDCNTRTEDQDNFCRDTPEKESNVDISNSRVTMANEIGSTSTKGSEIEAYSSFEDDQTALHFPVSQGQVDMVRDLLETDANVKKPNERRETPKAQTGKHANKGKCDLILNYENDKKLDRATKYSTNDNRKHTNVSSSVEARKSEKRVTIHMNFQKHKVVKQPAKLIILPDSLEELLKVAGQKYGDDSLTKVVNAENAEVDDLSVIRDGDHLFLFSSQYEGVN